MLRRLGSMCMHRLAEQPPSCSAGLPGAAGATAWPLPLQTLSALAAMASGSAGAALHTSAPVQQDFVSLNTLSDNPGATKKVRSGFLRCLYPGTPSAAIRVGYLRCHWHLDVTFVLLMPHA